MSNILEYRPQLQYKRDLMAHLKETEYDADPNLEGHDHPTVSPVLPSEQLIEDGARKGYVPSQSVVEAVDITKTDLILLLHETKNKIDTLVDKFIDKLKNNVTITPTIEEYIKAREENDSDVMYAFEDRHTDFLDGLTEAEVLPVLFDLKEELQYLEPFITEHLFPEELSTDLPYLIEQVERLRTEETAAVKHMIEQDRAGELDVQVVQEENHLHHFIDNRLHGIGGMVEEIEVLNSVIVDNVYSNSGLQIKEMVSQDTAAASQLKRVNEIHFEKHRANAEDALTRMRRLVTKEYKKKLLEAVTQAQRDKLDSRSVLSFIKRSRTREDDPVNLYFFDVLDTVEEVRNECDTLVADLYRIGNMEHLQAVDYLVSLEKKNRCRLVGQLL